MSDFAEVMESGLRRLEIDIQVARENLTANPYLAIAALADLEHGSEMTINLFEQSADAQAAARSFTEANGEPTIDEVHVQLDALYEAGGIDLSHFNGTCDCEKQDATPSDNAPKVTVLDIRVDRNGKVSVEDLTADFASSRPKPEFTG